MPVTRTQLVPGYYFSPGFYMGYWKNTIIPNFTPSQIKGHDTLKKHREVWLGAIMAAAETKESGKQHWVGLPDTEPPDVDIIYYEDTVTANGTPGRIRKHIKVEITRCDLDAGETLLGQILGKNRPAYSGMVLAVYVYGNQTSSDYNAVLDSLNEETEIYPIEIVAIELAEMAGNIIMLPNTYGISRIWPRSGSKIVRLSDATAFFREPEDVIGEATPRLSTGTQSQDLGSFTLLPPTIS